MVAENLAKMFHVKHFGPIMARYLTRPKTTISLAMVRSAEADVFLAEYPKWLDS